MYLRVLDTSYTNAYRGMKVIKGEFKVTKGEFKVTKGEFKVTKGEF